MKLAFVVNDLESEGVNYTTTRLALSALARGHEVWHIPLADFAYDPDEQVHARAVRAPHSRYRSAERFLGDLRSEQAVAERISVDELDVLMLRNDPSIDLLTRPWARLAGVNFGRLAMRKGVIVLNDPDGLNHAVNKMYLQVFPKSVRPRTLISRNREDIKSFIHDEGGAAVLKPLAGSGGRSVFLITPEERANLNQMIDAVIVEGYAIAQEYLPQATAGDTRLFLMNGEILECDGEVALFQRVNPVGDMRSNMAVGGQIQPAELSDAMLGIVEAVRPQLVRDGMFLVGLDIVGDKLMEINVFSPGGLFGAGRMAGVNFTHAVIEALERKVAYRQSGAEPRRNIELAAQAV